MSLAYSAMIFAHQAHAGQVRKYTGNPYTDHLAEVAGILSTVERADAALAVAWLHDCVEDTGISLSDIDREFGLTVAIGVSGLSDVEIGTRDERKKLSRDRLSRCAGWIQTIKCADIISNTASIKMHDPEFSVMYFNEKRLMLEVLTRADKRLWDLAMKQVTA